MFAHAHSHSIKDHPGQAAGLAGVAMAAGAIGAMLFTPRRGSEVRGGLKRRAATMKEKTKHAKKDADQTSLGDIITPEKPITPDKPAQKGDKDVTEEIRRQGEP